MKKRVGLPHRSDLLLTRGPFTRLATWVTGIMVFLAILAVTAGLTLNGMASDWRQDLDGSATLQVIPLPGDSEQDFKDRLQAALDLAHANPGVKKAEVMSVEHSVRLLRPWLGEGVNTTTLPLPRLIDLRMKKNADLYLKTLKEYADNTLPGVSVDDHVMWRHNVTNVLGLLQLSAWAISGIVTACATIVVVFATRGALSEHQQAIRILHLTGAEDRYIARQFQSHALAAALRGSVPASLLSLLVIMSLTKAITPLFGENMIKDSWLLLPTLEQGIVVLITPLIAATLTAVTTRLTVLRMLSKRLSA